MRTTRKSRKPLLLLSALLVVLSLFLAACGDDTEAVEAGSGDDSSSTDDGNASSDDPTSDDDGSSQPGDTGSGDPAGMCAAESPDCVDTVPPGEPRPVEPVGAVDPRPNAWDSFTASDDGLTLTFSFYMGVETCYSLDQVQVDETDTTVTVTIFTGGNPDLEPDTACIEIAELRSVDVTLDAPLGDREVVDGSL